MTDLPIGILGGTFDPIHNGHLRLALECTELLRLAQVRLIPVHTPPHRQAPATTPAQRLRMAGIACEGLSAVAADDREVSRGGRSYTIDTLRSLRAEFGDRPVCMIMGRDAFNSLHDWKDWGSLLDFVHIVIAERPGSAQMPVSAGPARVFAEHVVDSPAELAERPAGAIFMAEVPLLDMSASQVRALIKAGRSARFLLPDAVLEFIQSERLYRT